MGRRLRHFRRTLSLWGTAAAALFAFVPFSLNLLVSIATTRRDRRRIGEIIADRTDVPVDEPGGVTGSGTVYMLAGEESGDLHAANLVRAILAAAPGVTIRGMGGPRMERAGCVLDHDLVRMSVMGILPVIRSIGTFFGLYRRLLELLDENPPDVFVPIDYPGLNLRVARAARKRGVKVVYYIAPQVWAWAPWRVRRIARVADRMLVILPFERELLLRSSVPCSFVGHPLIEHLSREAPRRDRLEGRPTTVGILPGSRRAEVRGTLKAMLRAARRIVADHPEVRLVLPHQGEALGAEIEKILAEEAQDLSIRLVMGRTHEVMRDLDYAFVVSGTATLELAYYGVPMVVLYRIGRMGALLKRLFLISPHVALVNIVAGGPIMPEYVGAGDYAGDLADRLEEWLSSPSKAQESREALDKVRSRLLFSEVAERAAGWVLREMRPWQDS